MKREFDWKNKDFGKTLICDIDGVILRFDGFKGNDIFDDAIEGAEETLKLLHDKGWYIMLFTSRLVTFELINHLDFFGISFLTHFDDINGRRQEGTDLLDLQSYTLSGLKDDRIHIGKYWSISPKHSSFKPIASAILDDKNWENNGKNYTKDKWEEAKRSLISRFP